MRTIKWAVLYMGDYKVDEESALKGAGVLTLRWNGGDQVATNLAISEHTWLLRTRRLSSNEFGELYRRLLGFGVNLATSPLAFETIDDFELYYPSIANMTPRAIVSPPDASAGDLLSRMLAAGMSFPAFLRSDIESAAKFVGVDGCIISSASLVEVERIVGSLRKYVRGFRKIIVKEVARIKRAENGKSLEYRAIGVGGGFVTFDYDPEITNLPPPTEYGLVDSAKQALKQLAAGGGNGAVFVDFAVTESRAPMLVECKDFSNGSVNCPVVLATALNRLSE